ncbi:MAG: hypothetical protein A2655_03905 [Candidatus Yanofskybacteria bacterium RIFCSPHIGHO2_01_FULL_43_42]|uniref:Methyltransferase domain-containing protein n=1 Tax=Candidatus Yanofskybacteria bacterium RIFCSPLOWO2_01_FULL_43_22 TaxID=1802695 RepID=A0A1F8GD95_9BACT|nr:MAG: hypothetical protein A2655_03905 [Candidatus Yanofskybacteria bacterium RIFCSPHIGHO2_01_FULL_43_42]OGN12638.1 MAG: hypothetical protein A3D48_01255 [Candidatus Yanofskybacteria bacterium RIFCSPHIGHO2_02_FULL_43_17]OGN23261.1 MAG: hypothetical protein A3A13_04020 [Candidatus Yanofskybacteria bacterium RIFCSPLOWO2_01_FULL_43_22]
MPDEWSNKDFAEDWDNGGAAKHPVRKEHLDMLISIISDGYSSDKYILDLGYGSGQVEEMLYAQIPDANIVGTDNSDVMIELSKKRLGDKFSKLTVINHSLEDIEALELPKGNYQYVISVQALHHLTHDQQKKIFQFVYNTLGSGGSFLFIDRIALDVQTFEQSYKAIYEKMFNKPFEGYKKDIEQKGDYPGTPEEHISWLQEVGFKATCLNKKFDRAFILGVKK